MRPFLAALVAILGLAAQGALAATIPLMAKVVPAEHQVNDTCHQPRPIEPRANDHIAARGAADLIESGFTIVPASFTDNFGPNGELMTLNGTIEEVVAQVAAINPAYEWSITTAAKSDSGTLAAHAKLSNIDMYPWRKLEIDFLDCDVSKGGRALQDNINYGATQYLSKVKGKAGLRTRTCTRVSCAYDSAIYLCYEPRPCTKSPGYEVGWDYVGLYAQGISEEWCPTVRGKKTGFLEVGGKVWDPKGMAVQVRWDKC